MKLAAGERLGNYEILGPLGAGAMGEVYRARDLTLRREVAIKILPAAFAANADRLARFEREARLLASLNHPHIAQIHAVLDAAGASTGGVHGLVLELVEGLTLEDVIRSDGGSDGMTVSRALLAARQIAAALDAAHERGIVHRDLKPANIKITPEGAVKVLDFGLAKAAADSQIVDGSDASTILTDATSAGTILGTPVYMSPEQARGMAVDKRTDIWAFGCVLYEMLTRRRAFGGDTMSDVVAAVLDREPDWTLLPSSTPRSVRHLLKRCLEKDPRQRLRDMGDARVDLDAAGADSTPAAENSSPRGARWRVGSLLALGAGLIGIAIGATLASGAFSRTVPTAATPLSVRFLLHPPADSLFYETVETNSFALSPDGSQLAFVASDSTNGRQVWLRRLNALDATALPGTTSATSAFWSPDSRSIGFFAGNKLKRLDLAGGTPVPICDVPTGVGLFGSWGAAGQAVFGSVEGKAIFSVSMTGGEAVEIVTPDPTRLEWRVLWPTFLPDGQRFLYLAQLPGSDGRVMMRSPGAAPSVVLSAVSRVQYVEPGYLLFVREGVLFSQRFDTVGGRVTGAPFPVSETVNYFLGTGMAYFTASLNGVLAFQANRVRSRLVWISRSGEQVGTTGEAGGFLRLRISPDGRRVAFDRTQPEIGTYDLWSADIDRGTETRLTSAPTSEGGGVWTPDGSALFFQLARGGSPRIFRRDMATGAEREVLPQGTLQEGEDVSPNGAFLVYSQRTGDGHYDIWALPLSAANAVPVPIVQAPFDQLDARLSPDGNYMAYTSDESGRPEIYVTTFPVTGEVTRVSTAGGRAPRWNRSADELFYLSADRRLQAVSVRTLPRLQIGTPAPLFALDADIAWRTFDVLPDGRRFLAIVPEVPSGSQPLVVVSNWMTTLKP